MSLREIFIKNSITYKIYIYYNLYIRNKAYRKRKFYSQWGEDIFLQKHFENKNIGFYVDIGCFHPIMYSNTCLLFHKGWSGINIDLNQTSIDLFKIVRPSDYNICAAISDKISEQEIFFDHFFSPINTIQKSFYDKSDKNISFKKLRKKKVITKTFSKAIENIYNLPNIDFLNIDCEGHDHEVLKSFNLKKFMPTIVCIETHDIDNKEVYNYKNIINLLNECNYDLIKRCGPSSFFKIN